VAAGPFSDPHAFDERAVADFQRDGHVLVLGLADRDELAPVAPRISELALRHAWDRRPLSERDTYGQAFLQAFNLWRLDDTVAEFVLGARFAGVAAALLGADAVRLYHDQALFKEPGGGPTPWHQDQYYWPFDRPSAVTMWMPLVDVSEAMGPMMFVSGSHRIDDMRGTAISDRSQAMFEEQITARGLTRHSCGALRAGDATFHAGWTVHGAPGNDTDQMRAVMTVIYVADGTRVATELSRAQDFDRVTWLGGAEPGTVIDHDLNPRLG
jgi:hypothetical protein